MTFCGDGLGFLAGVALLRLDRLARVVHAEDAPPALAVAAGWRAGRPRAHLPDGAGQVAAGLDVGRLQASVAVAGEEAGAVLALHLPPGPAGAAALGALGPLPQHPLGHAEGVDDVQRGRGLALLGPAEGGVSGDEEGVLDLGGDEVGGGGQQLDGDGLPQPPEALDPLQGGGGAAVLQHRPQDGNVLLHRGDGVVAVEDVAAALALDGQVAAVVLESAGASLLDVDVCGAGGDGDDVAVAVAAGESRDAGSGGAVIYPEGPRWGLDIDEGAGQVGREANPPQ